MTSKNDYVVYSPLPPNPTGQNVVVLTRYRPPPGYLISCRLRFCLLCTAALLLVSASVFFFYPSDPALQLVRIRLNHIHVHSASKLVLDASFSLTVKVRNTDFFSLDYDSLVVWIGYRGSKLGFVRSDGGHVRARGSSYVNATLDLSGWEVLHDVIYFIEDLSRGVIPFDTETDLDGKLGLFSFNVPLKARVSCEVYVHTNDHTIVRQDCFPQ